MELGHGRPSGWGACPDFVGTSSVATEVKLAVHSSSAEPAAIPADPLYGSYFVAAYPPFSRWQPDQTPAVHRHLESAPRIPESPFGLYVHIPFCEHRCDFCYFLSYADRGERIDSYVDALIAELALYRETRQLASRNLGFIYFGGGTPSLLSETRLDRLLDGLRRSFSFDSATEVTFECAPRSVTQNKAKLLREAGVTRLSLGVQQLDDEILERNGRVHRVADVERAYDIVSSVGFEVVNLDLIVGLVGETDLSFFRSLDRALSLDAESVTVYQLEIPHNTPLYRQMKDASEDGDGDDAAAAHPELPDWDLKRARLAEAFRVLTERGYHPITAYAAVKDPEKHRFAYMAEQYRGADLIGIGASSFSYLDGVHYQNLPDLNGYLDRMASGELPLHRARELDATEQLTREFVLQLKLGEVDIDRLRRKYGQDPTELFDAPLRDARRAGFLIADRHRVTLTERGRLRVDRMIPEFYA